MTSYDVTGQGIIPLTSGTTKVFVEILVRPPGVSVGTAFPQNPFHVGFVRPGFSDHYYPPIPVDGNAIVVDLPLSADSLGWSAINTAVLRLIEYPSSGPPPTAFLVDALTDTDGTPLTSHSPTVGSTWVGGDTSMQCHSNGAYMHSAGSFQQYANNATPPSADYTVEADITVYTAGSGGGLGVLGRNSTAGGYDCYFWSYYKDAGEWRLIVKSPSSFYATLGTFVDSFADGETKHLALGMSGTTITGSVNGSVVVSVTNSDLSAAGFAGIWGEPSDDGVIVLQNLHT